MKSKLSVLTVSSIGIFAAACGSGGGGGAAESPLDAGPLVSPGPARIDAGTQQPSDAGTQPPPVDAGLPVVDPPPPAATWGNPIQLASGLIKEIAIATNENGEAVLVYEEDTNCTAATASRMIHAVWYTPSQGWATPQTVGSEQRGCGGSAGVSTALSANGTAFIVRDVFGPSGSGTVFSGTRAGGWAISTVAGSNIRGAGIGADAQGNATAIWEQNAAVLSSRYSAGRGWSAPAALEQTRGSVSFSPLIAVSANGDAFVSWIAWDGSANSIRVARWTGENGWSRVATLDTANVNSSANLKIYWHRLAVNASGQAVAVWTKRNSSFTNDVFAGRFDPLLGWSAASLISASLTTTGDLDVAVDRGGNAIAVWGHQDGVSGSLAFSRYVTTGGGWGQPSEVATNPSVLLYFGLGVGADEQAAVSWKDGDSIFARSFGPAAGWGTTERIRESPHSSLDSIGNRFLATVGGAKSFVVWTETNLAGGEGERSLFAIVK